MAKICFLSYEIHPTLKGGCGVLLHHSARCLLENGHTVIFLLDVDIPSFQQFNQIDRLELPNAENCRAYQASALLGSSKIHPRLFKTWFEYKAYVYYAAARQIYRLEKPDIIEFFEYCGIAYHALSAKIAGLDFEDTHLTVRLHNSLEMIDREQPSYLHGLDRYIMYGLEHQALRLAETVLYPSKAYLEEIYLRNYEPWFGSLVHSPPAMLDYPNRLGELTDPDGILFLGRLFGFKGVDRFVDAAVLYLSNPQNPRRKFYLVGYDSLLPPTGKGRYQDYLMEKVPAEYREFFIFPGQISWKELGLLLPKISFAVIPSLLESFCYAAHELYEAGVPLIVADIPAFRDSFKDGINALKFDGTISDLAEKMVRLSGDAQLREKISRPFSLNRTPLGDFYSGPAPDSWIQTEATPLRSQALTVCIINEEPAELDQTAASIAEANLDTPQIIVMSPKGRGSNEGASGLAASIWFLGRQYAPRTLDGRTINPTEVKTSDALIILKAGDRLDREFLPRALSILCRQPQISFVGCWQRVVTWNGTHSDTLPYDCMMEALPYLRSSGLNRAVMRTDPGRLLIDLFDPRAGLLGELAYLWGLESPGSCGTIIPEFWLTRKDERDHLLSQPYLDYIHIRDDSPIRKERLARLHLSLARRERVLRHFYVVNRQSKPYEFWIAGLVYRLAVSRLSKWADRYPGLKKAARIVVENILALVMKSPKKKVF